MPYKDPEVRKAYLKAYNKLPKVIRKRKIYHKKYMSEWRKTKKYKEYINHPDYKTKQSIYKKKYNKKPLVIISKKKYNKSWYLKNREKKLQQNSSWIKKNQSKYNAMKRKNYIKNKDKRNLNYKKRIKEDINFKIKKYVSSRLRNGLARFNQKKNKGKRTQEYLGCSYSFFAKYLEKKFKKGMSWKNFGRNGWEIDHIKPLAKFDLTKVNHQKKAFNFKNTQPLWRKENRLKGDKILN